MTQSMDRLDRLVEDYLGAVSYACLDLPPDQRDDLVAELRSHIEAARAVLYQPSEAAVRTILDRLGEPAAIAAEARLADPFSPSVEASPSAPGPARTATHSPWLSRPMSPVTVAILLGFALLLITVMVLSIVMALSEVPPIMPGEVTR
jgi:uncharacterized membrane protein